MNKNIIAISLSVMIFSFPFLTNSLLYIDDFNRGISGVYIWINDGRPFAQFIYWVFNFGGLAIIGFPSITLMAIVLLIFSIYKICENNQLGIFHAIGLTFIVVNPFFSQSMLYKYDSFIMISAIAIVYLCFISRTKQWHILSVILLALSISTYQTSIAIYAALSSLELLYNRKNGYEYALKTIANRFVSAIIATIIYKISLNFVDLSPYALEHSSLITSGDVSDLKRNIHSFYDIFNSVTTSFKSSTILIIIFLISILSTTLEIIKNKDKSKIFFIYIIFVYLCSVFSFVMVFGGISLMLLNPVFEPRAMTASYVFIFFLISSLTIVPDIVKLTSVFILFAFSAYTSSAINMAYTIQENFNKNIYTPILNITNTRETYKVYFNGQPDKSIFVNEIESKIPLSKKINFYYFNNDLFSDLALSFNGIKAYTPGGKIDDIKNKDCDKKSENAFASVCLFGDNILVNFK